MPTDNQTDQQGRENGNEPKQEQSKKGKNRFKKNKSRNSENSSSGTVGAFTNSRFKGGTLGMNSYVFQLFSEHKTRSQFQDTIGQLRIHAATSYKDQVKHLQVLFDELDEPRATKPKYPNVPTGEKGNSLEPDAGDLAIYTEEMKEFVKTKRMLENTVHSLYL